MGFKSKNTILLSSFIILDLLSIDRKKDLASAHDEFGGALLSLIWIKVPKFNP